MTELQRRNVATLVLKHLRDKEFNMSDAQQVHALAVERLAPRLAALRIELCPGYMSEGCFWKIYFALLNPRINEHGPELLSTPQGIGGIDFLESPLGRQILKTRASLTQELQNRTKSKPEQDWSRGDKPCSNDISNVPHEKSDLFLPMLNLILYPFRCLPSNQLLPWWMQILKQKSTVVLEEKYDDDGDDWLKEESSEIIGTGGTTIPIENDEDVSFSDLEEDDGDVPTSDKKVTYGSDSSVKESRDWVQLSRTSADATKDTNAVGLDRAGTEPISSHNPDMKESNDWLDIDEIDVG
ncbi:Protein PRRC2A like [Actinidia chinensis var. chinensis]|uniref:Protein PRRC2A like n=1 Tax=Actinidia chinensis var. chinensis TaxID=1590841 RepID=A0A2R6PA76_ACTCC|nr:Protein PRRC2A like [Actinidia chinensis var. chinensis]